jgi:aerobic-type carbon monoxide dehydrogenase small subunit (CoxS/CutS family)
MTSASTTAIKLSVNGAAVEFALPENTSVLSVLRHDLALTATRTGCGQGNCGACTVLLDGKAVQSCTLPLWSAAGHSITTIESATTDPLLAMVKNIFIDKQAAQCGYCTNGIIMSVAAALKQSASRDEIIRTMDERHLCRCGANLRILRAVDLCIAAANQRGLK